MFPLLLGLATALAADPETERLLGPDPTPTPLVAPRMASASNPAVELVGLWPIGVTIAGAAVLWIMSRVRRLDPGPDLVHVDVVGRAGVGGNAALQVVDVQDAKGNIRRLLLATGTGAPTLIADLGETSAEDGTESEEAPVHLMTRATRPLPLGLVPPVAEPQNDRKAQVLGLIDEVIGNARRASSGMRA
ncbi:MAG: hypothetical protein KC621_08010 [Myxococcales bacterium]|nr:hypothetical protein [Myxococcales bacterium]